MFPSLTPSTQTSSGLFGGVIGQGNNNGVASAPTSLFGVPAGGSGTSTFTFGQPLSLTPTAFGTPSFTAGFSLSSTPTLFGTPSFSPTSSPLSFTGTSPAISSTLTPFGTPSFSSVNPNGTLPAFSLTRTPFGPSSTIGTPSPSYVPTTVVETSGGNQTTRLKFISISAMPAYDTKSHEELRWDNYMAGKTTGKTTAPFNPVSINSSAVKSLSSVFPPFSSSPANNISTTSWPSTTTSPTWNYSGPIAFTSSNTYLTTAPSNSSNPFAINLLVKSTSSDFPPGSSLPVTTSWQTTTTSPHWISPGTTVPSLTSRPPHISPSTNTTMTTDPSKSFNPFAPKTSLTSPATTFPFNPFSINSSTVKSSSSAFPPFSFSTANTISATSWPSTTTSPTWNYTGPIAFTSSNMSLTTTPSNSSNPFAIDSLVKSTSSGFPPGSSLPITTSWQTTTTSPHWISPGTTVPSLTSQPPHISPSTNTTMTTDPSKSFKPFAPKTSLNSPATTFPFTPLNRNPFQIPSTSLPTQSTSSSFPSTTCPLRAAWPTSVEGPFPRVPAATNSVTVSPGSCELTPTHNQLTSAAASPFGILPPSPRLSFSRSAPIQYGISSIPVKNKPAPVRYPLLTTRRFSRGGKLPIRKYDPKLTGPKIPYYSVTSEMPETFFVLRENPRALIITREKSPPRENMHEELLSGSMYEKERDGISADTCSEDPVNDQDLFARIVDVPSKPQQPDYYTQPQISVLEAKERAEPGYCRRVKDFVVGRHGYGSIKFFGETDVRKLDLESLIQFNNREVIVYMDESKKPPVGEGLNIPAEITLLNIKCIDKKTGMQCVDGSKIDRYTAMLKKKAATQGAEFVSYNAVEGEWKFRVQHF